MAEAATARGDTGVDQEVGAQAEGEGGGLLPAADENQVGQLQPPSREHSAEYRVGEEAERPA
ncbi:hypothetical protein D3C85_1720740 [compost metagenome]